MDAMTRGTLVKQITEQVVSNLSAAGRFVPRPGDRTLIASGIVEVLYPAVPVDIPTWEVKGGK